MTIWASDLIMKALDFTPVTATRWNGDATVCGHCGKPVFHGDSYSQAGSSEFFSDTRHLSDLSGIVCAACSYLKTQAFTFTVMNKVITEDAVYPITKDVYKRWLFLTPPEQPFIANVSSAKMQHLAFRTPVSLSPKRFYLRYGRHLFTIRPDTLREAIGINQELQARSDKEHERLYIVNDREMNDANHGRISYQARKILPEQSVRFIENLSPGETWAMGYLLTREGDMTEKPPAVTEQERAKIKSKF